MVNEAVNTPRPMVTIFDNDGVAHEATPLNARELVAGGSFTWNVEGPTIDPVAEEISEEVTEVVESEEPDAPIDTASDWLADIAERILGSRDIESYLEKMTVVQLRDLAEMRYDVKIHHRSSQGKAIERIVELENEKIEAAESIDASSED